MKILSNSILYLICLLSLSGCSTISSIRPVNRMRSILHLELDSSGYIGTPEFEKTLDTYTNSRIVEGNLLINLQNGNSYFPELIKDIEAATDTINIAVYDFTIDEIGSKIKNKLIEAAKRGVTVRVTYDKFGCDTKLSDFDDLVAVGAEVRTFNPVKRWTVLRLNSRNHRKIIVIDHKISFISGLNLSDNYNGNGFDGWRDSGVKITGPVNYEIEKIFSQTWNQAGAHWIGMNLPIVGSVWMKRIIDYPFMKLFGDMYEAPKVEIEPTGNTAIRIVEQSPEWIDSYHINLFTIAINAAQESVYISTPYFLPPALIKRALINAAERGVDVRILTQGETDLPLFKELAEGEFYPYAKKGVRFWSWYNSILHNKCTIIDNKFVIGGSVNFDCRSLLMNYEVAFCISDSKLVEDFSKVFLADIAIAKEHSVEDTKKMETDKTILFAPIRGQL